MISTAIVIVPDELVLEELPESLQIALTKKGSCYPQGGGFPGSRSLQGTRLVHILFSVQTTLAEIEAAMPGVVTLYLADLYPAEINPEVTDPEAADYWLPERWVPTVPLSAMYQNYINDIIDLDANGNELPPRRPVGDEIRVTHRWSGLPEII